MRNPSAAMIAVQNGDLDDPGDIDNAASELFSAANEGWGEAGTFWLEEALRQIAEIEQEYYEIEWDRGAKQNGKRKRPARR